MKKLSLLVITSLLLSVAYAQAPDTEAAAAAEALPAFPLVRVQTSAGSFLVELDSNRAPLTVLNFLEYVDSGFYSDTVFHRVVGGFVIQGGGYDTEYRLKPTRKNIPNESGNGLSNRRGTLAMARTGDPHSADSQFYINLADNVGLDPMPTRWGYTVFGRVTEGMEVIDDIGYRATGAGPIPELTRDVPREPIVITGMERLEPQAEDATNASPAQE